MVRVPLRRTWFLVCGCALTWSAMAGPVEDAQQAYDRGDYTRAVDRYNDAAEASPTLRSDPSFMKSWQQAEARVAYQVGSKLHAERAYSAAVEQFMHAIGKDPSYKLAYAALEDAQRAGIQQHLLRALESADRGDLLAAKRELESSLVLGGSGDPQVKTALAGIVQPEQTFDEATLAKLAEARRLGDDRQWELAERQLMTIVKQHPLLLAARAELTRATRLKTMSVTMTDQAAALIAQQRLSPALEKLAGAASIWPYNDRAAELLESVETKVKRAESLVEVARQHANNTDWRDANEKLLEALAIDPSNAKARALRSEVRVGLVSMLGEDARAALGAGDTQRARTLLDRGMEYWPNNRWTRGDLAQYQLALSEKAAEADRTGEAYLRALLASRDAVVTHQLNAMERSFLNQTQARYAYDIEPSTQPFGVESTTLTNALSAQAAGSREQHISCIRLQHGEAAIDRFVEAHEQADARFLVRVRITDTDIDLRQRSNGAIAYNGTSFGNTGQYAFNNNHYWEKYGKVDAAVVIIDQTTGKEIDRWTANRWANYTDRQQYVIDRQWNDSYWTLPTDEAIETRLARDLAADIQPAVEQAITLAKAKSLRRGADAMEKQDPAAAMDQRVSAVILAGQINPRDARRELRRMAKALDEAYPTGYENAAE